MRRGPRPLRDLKSTSFDRARRGAIRRVERARHAGGVLGEEEEAGGGGHERLEQIGGVVARDQLETRWVPAAVPSDFHSSRPVVPSVAVKYTASPKTVSW